MSKERNVQEAGTPHTGQYVLYFRVSDEKQGKSGLGLEAQEVACRAKLNGGDWEVLATFREIASGYNQVVRPELEKALALCEKTGATLLVARLDRLARNVAFVSRLMQSRVKFECADMPHVNDLTIHIVAAMAESYSKSLSHATKEGLKAKKRRGETLGSKKILEVATMGREKRTQISMEYAETVYATIERIRSFGITSLRGIANELTDRKVETPLRQRKLAKGQPVFGAIGREEGQTAWGPQQVKNVLERIENQKKS